MKKSLRSADQTLSSDDASTRAPLLLIVEKEEDYAILFQRIFTKIAQHWRVARVSNVKEAIGYLVQKEFPDLLVTNLETSQLKARDIIEWLLCIKTPKPVSILIFDRAPSVDQEKELADFGVREYLNKRAPTEQYRSVLHRLTLDIDGQSVASTSPESAKAVGPGFARKF